MILLYLFNIVLCWDLGAIKKLISFRLLIICRNNHNIKSNKPKKYPKMVPTLPSGPTIEFFFSFFLSPPEFSLPRSTATPNRRSFHRLRRRRNRRRIHSHRCRLIRRLSRRCLNRCDFCCLRTSQIPRAVTKSGEAARRLGFRRGRIYVRRANAGGFVD